MLVVSIKYPQIKIKYTNFRDKKGNYMVAILIFILTKKCIPNNLVRNFARRVAYWRIVSLLIYKKIKLFQLLDWDVAGTFVVYIGSSAFFFLLSFLTWNVLGKFYLSFARYIRTNKSRISSSEYFNCYFH